MPKEARTQLSVELAKRSSDLNKCSVSDTGQKSTVIY
jgi:hypothetical protein